MTDINLQLRYHAGQDEIFFQSTARKRIVAKGRRWGFTKGSAQFVIEQLIDGVSPILWGDTTTANIHNYMERYFLPILNKLPHDIWTWKKTEKKLFIRDAVCDFRSADQPENWEGFGYKLVLLNEAGIILQDPYLWSNAVRPMLMDFPDSVAIVGGTPKGRNQFFQLHQTSKKDWQSFTFDSFSNPFVKKEEIEDLISDLPDAVVQQEIYADFNAAAENVLIPWDSIQGASERNYHVSSYLNEPVILGIDIARFGKDSSEIVRRQGVMSWPSITIKGQLNETNSIAARIAAEIREHKPDAVFIDSGYNPGVIDVLRGWGYRINEISFAGASPDSDYLNMRAYMWAEMGNWLKRGCIPNDPKLKSQLSGATYDYAKSNGKLKLNDKSEMEESPNKADALGLTFAAPVRKSERLTQNHAAYHEERESNWSPFEYA